MSGVQHKMYNYQVTPPAGVWEKIAAELDESELEYEFPNRLHDLQVSPPAAAWQRIKNSLDAEQEAAIPEHRRLSPLVRYAASAAVIGFLAWGAMQLLNKNNKASDDDIAIKEQIKQTENNPSPETTRVPVIPRETVSSPGDKVVNTDDARNDAALEASKKTYASLDVPARSKIKNVSDFYFVPDNTPSGTTRGLNIEDYYPEEPILEETLANRYIMLMTPDGNIIRMSKKLGDLVCCVSGEDQDDDCLKQMKKWREKIASPSTGHSPGNFMDILSLLKSLQDNNL